MRALHPVQILGAAALLLAAAYPDAAVARDYSRTCFDCDIPWAWDDEPPRPVDPPYPQGFALTVPLRPEPAGTRPHAGSDPARRPVLNRYSDVGDALGLCWNPASDVRSGSWGTITLRVSFKRDGTINGVPRIVYVSSEPDPKVRADLVSSLLSALSRCTPLNLSPSLGQAIAGQIFAIRFIRGQTI